MQKITVSSLIGWYAVSYADGKILYDTVASLLQAGDNVEIDFNGVLLASPFLNGGVANLVKDFDPDVLNTRVELVNLPPYARGMLNKIVDAQNYDE